MSLPSNGFGRAKKKLGKLRRLTPGDIDEVELKQNRVLDALIASAKTGKTKLIDSPLEGRVKAISTEGLRALIALDIWGEALRGIIALDAVHPDAQRGFLEAWKRMQFHECMKNVGDDLFFTGLRKMLPPYHADRYYDGENPVTLYRGQAPDAPIGYSWTAYKPAALHFAAFGFVDPEYDPEDWPIDLDNVVLTAEVPTSAIICAPLQYVRRDSEYEFIVDPRGITPSSSERVAEFDEDWREIARHL
jgi:hypothetical protein